MIEFDSFVGSYQRLLKSIFTASLLDVQHVKRLCGEKAGKFTRCVYGKALHGILPSSSGRYVVRVAVDLNTERSRHCSFFQYGERNFVLKKLSSKQNFKIGLV